LWLEKNGYKGRKKGRRRNFPLKRREGREIKGKGEKKNQSVRAKKFSPKSSPLWLKSGNNHHLIQLCHGFTGHSTNKLINTIHKATHPWSK